MKYERKTIEPEAITSRQCQIIVLKERCKSCGFCIEFCPRQCIQESAEFNHKGYHPVEVNGSDDCLKCSLCELICPEFAICVLPLNEEAAYD